MKIDGAKVHEATIFRTNTDECAAKVCNDCKKLNSTCAGIKWQKGYFTACVYKRTT